ncbi:flavin reductase [Acetobacterium tundrae]|uniref:Flavin reductase n=1 Tax=Acetobacterium tundrae TaxID=132932 RepID=A0ABR6WMF4_9FIRM|nr:flavin reductase [Acetobacterium tundrae]MBC3797307.1 flavin reductase [Acetobacterium tundrae]
MDTTAMFSLTYGLFVAGVAEGGKKNACIINTAVQATAEPVRMHVTMLKENLTTQLIRKKGSLTISVLSLDCPLELIGSFGMRSGREVNKFDGIDYQTDGNGNPYLDKNTVAYMSLNVASVIDLESHYLFICDVVEAEKTQKGQPMSYGDYRTLKSGGTVGKEGAKAGKKHWVCSVCHYVYDGKIPFEELPDDWTCPVCQKPKSVFILED